MDYILFTLFAILSYISDGAAYTICYKQGLFAFDTSFVCYYDCCGTYRTKYCCPRPSTYFSFNTAAITGIVFGVFTFIVIIVVISMCYKKKYYGRVLGTGRVGGVQTVQVTQTTATTMATAYQPYPSGYTTGAYPPTVGQPVHTATNGNYAPPLSQYPPGQQISASAPAYPPGYNALAPAYSAPPPTYNQAQAFPAKY